MKKNIYLGKNIFFLREKIVKNPISFLKTNFLMAFVLSGGFANFSKFGPLHLPFCFHSDIKNKGLLLENYLLHFHFLIGKTH